MSDYQIATIVTSLASDGWGIVSVGDIQRPCYFAPRRFVAPYRVPEVGNRVMVSEGPAGLTAVWLVGRSLS